MKSRCLYMKLEPFREYIKKKWIFKKICRGTSDEEYG